MALQESEDVPQLALSPRQRRVSSHFQPNPPNPPSPNSSNGRNSPNNPNSLNSLNSLSSLNNPNNPNNLNSLNSLSNPTSLNSLNSRNSPRSASSLHRYRSPNQFSRRLSAFSEFLKYSSPSLVSISENMADFGSSPRYVTSTSLTVILLEPWGSGNYVGLTGLEVVTLNQQKVSLTPGQISVFPRELMNVGWEGMVGNFGALFDGVNQTTDVNHMWLVPAVIEGKHPMIQIRFPVLMPICGIRIFNFNSNSIEAFNGAKFIQIFCNGSMIGVRFHGWFSFAELETPHSQGSGRFLLRLLAVHSFNRAQNLPGEAPVPSEFRDRSFAETGRAGFCLPAPSLRLCAEAPDRIHVGRPEFRRSVPFGGSGPIWDQNRHMSPKHPPISGTANGAVRQ